LKNVFRHLIPHFRRQWRWFAIGVLALLATNLIQQMIPQLLKRSVDALQSAPSGSPEMGAAVLLATLWALARLGAVVVQGFLRYGWRMGFFGMGRRVEYGMRRHLFGKLLTLSSPFFRRLRVGDLLSRAMSDLSTLRESLGFGWMSLFDSVSMVTFTCFFMLRVDWRLTLLTLAPMAAIPPLVMTLGRRVRDNSREAQALLDGLSQSATESFSGAKVIHAYARQPQEEQRFASAANGYRIKSLKLVRLEAFYWPLITMIASASELILIFRGGKMVSSGAMSLGTFAMLHEYLLQILWPVMALGFSSNMYIRGKVSMERLNEVYDEEPSIVGADVDQAPALSHGATLLKLQNVSFRYSAQGPDVLKGINLDVGAGEWIGLAGRTGSGKSTLLKLIPRLEDPSGGSVELWGRNTRQWPLRALRRRVAVVMQEPFLFSETLLENAAFAFEGDARHKFEQAVEASKAADFHATASQLPLGYESMLGEKGVNLSGGQKQRLALARALFAQPDLLLLDDAFSAVDTATEERIVSGLKQALPNAGVFLVSHRASTLRLCSRVLVLEDGVIKEQGRPDDLMQQEGFFFEMSRREQLARKAGLS
jgi:ATP-binding cassette subfamily B multidrug efflux pump